MNLKLKKHMKETICWEVGRWESGHSCLAGYPIPDPTCSGMTHHSSEADYLKLREIHK